MSYLKARELFFERSCTYPFLTSLRSSVWTAKWCVCPYRPWPAKQHEKHSKYTKHCASIFSSQDSHAITDEEGFEMYQVDCTFLFWFESIFAANSGERFHSSFARTQNEFISSFPQKGSSLPMNSQSTRSEFALAGQLVVWRRRQNEHLTYPFKESLSSLFLVITCCNEKDVNWTFVWKSNGKWGGNGHADRVDWMNPAAQGTAIKYTLTQCKGRALSRDN